jgi:hypothetical protein
LPRGGGPDGRCLAFSPLGCQPLPALPLALLAQHFQFRLGLLQPRPHPDLDLATNYPEPLQHRVVGEVIVSARGLEDPREGRCHPGEGLGAAFLGTGEDDDEVVKVCLPMDSLRPLGCWSEMSIPTSRIASMAQGWISSMGSIPVLYTSSVPRPGACGGPRPSGSSPSSGCTGTAPSACASLTSSSAVHQLRLHPIPDLVPHRTEDRQPLLLRALGP